VRGWSSFHSSHRHERARRLARDGATAADLVTTREGRDRRSLNRRTIGRAAVSESDSGYTRTWSPAGEIGFATLTGGSRVRFLKTGSGPPLILLHTVRTQLDHFQLVIPRLLHAFTVYAIDMPGMGWSDIVPGASYTEPALRHALVQFVTTLDLVGLTLAGESMGATVSLTASTELKDRVRSIVAFNPYDYPGGVARANRLASIYIGSACLAGIGPIVVRMENKPVLGAVLQGGLVDGAKLPDHYLAELRRVGRRRGYPRVAREVFGNVESMVAARAHYDRVTAPVTLIYGDHDWSRLSEREADLALLRGARSITLPATGHFAALEQPARVAEILLENADS
jgi:pimeloyl-ACP methyl ester carboxylesterase